MDTCVFVGLFGLFTAHVTGNFVLIGAELVHHSGDVMPKLLALPVFMLAVAVAARAVDALRQRGRNAVVAILAFEALFLFMSAAASFSLKAAAHSGDASALAIGMLACAAMGLQNAFWLTGRAGCIKNVRDGVRVKRQAGIGIGLHGCQIVHLHHRE